MTKSQRYEGAKVECFNTGLFSEKVLHYDIKSQYPMCMAVFNLSPESVQIVSVKPYTGKYRFEGNIIEVPDRNVGQLTCKISPNDSIARTEMIQLFKLRQKLRKNKDKAHQAMQTAIKLIMNSCYGYLGMVFARYGSYPCAIIITAIGRLIIDTIIKECDRLGVTKIECDTDGIYTQGRDISKEINARIQEKFKDYPLRHYLCVETNTYDGILMVKMKNYCLRSKDTLIFKGSGFHGRQLPNIIDVAFERFTRALFDGEDLEPIWSEFTKEALRDRPLRDFTMAVEISKPPDEYEAPKSPKHRGSLYWQLCSKLGDNIEFGDEIQYVKTRGGYLPLGVLDDEETLKEVDFKYYAKRVKDKIKWVLEVLEE